MKRKIKIIISTFACLTMMFNLVACSQENTVSNSGSTTSEKDKVTLKLSYGHGISDPAKSDETAFGYYFKEYIDEHCDSIDVQLYGGATLGSSEDVMGSIAANTVEMGVYEVGTLNNYDPETMVFSLPGAFRDSEEVNYMIDSQWAKDFFEESSKDTNLMVLGGACKGMRCFNVEGYELRKVEDIAGLTLRVMDTPLYVELIEALGANPVPMAMSEVYVAIQNNVIDGQENPVVNIVNDILYEVTDWVVLDNHAPCIVLYYISRDFFENLSDNQQVAVREAAAYAQEKAREVLVNLNNEAITTLESHGMTVYEPTAEELEDWHAKFAPVCEQYMRDQIGDEIVDGLLEVIEDYRA